MIVNPRKNPISEYLDMMMGTIDGLGSPSGRHGDARRYGKRMVVLENRIEKPLSVGEVVFTRI